jgi:hypothetical protein
MTQALVASERRTDIERQAHLETQNAFVALQHKMECTEVKCSRYYKLLRNERRKNQRLQASKKSLTILITELQSVQLPAAIMEAQRAEERLFAVTVSYDRSQSNVTALKATLVSSRQKIRNLQMQCLRAKHSHAQNLIKEKEKIRKQSLTYRMLHKGTYLVGIRKLIRALVKSGCSQEHVGPMIRMVGETIGVRVRGKLSRRTVSRCIREGGVAARIQLGYELAQAKSTSQSVKFCNLDKLTYNKPGFTTSSDGTTHRNVTYDSRHFAYKVQRHPDSASLRPVIRVMSVSAALNHTAETQFNNMQADFDNIVTTFDSSPLGQHSDDKLTPIDMKYKWAGCNADHSADQKAMHTIAKNDKHTAIEMDLGSKSLLAQGPDVLIATMEAENLQKINDAGGVNCWNSLSTAEQVSRDVIMMKRFTIRLGKEALAVMPEDDRRKLLLFIWAGCSMHKELNSVKGGNKGMMAWWKENNIPGPILLANRDNAAIIRDITEDVADDVDVGSDADLGNALGAASGAPTKAQQRAIDVTTAGGVKAASIAGAIFNHKDDKKGQQDSYRYHFQSVLGRPCNFPDTSSIRYHCFCAAAAELIAYTPDYLEFLDEVKMSKDKPGFNHMEQNLWDALHDAKTKSELAVLAVYLCTVSAPYARFIRGPGTEEVNMLDLGPYHFKLKEHIKTLIDNPSLALGPEAKSATATLDGEQWHHPDAMQAVLAQASELPYLTELFVAFLTEALVTWERFTSEFDYGGLIDSATAEEKDLAWIPTTNDANEGRLGSWRLFARTNPNSTIEQYNNIATFWKNDTQLFMDFRFTPADHKHIQEVARREDASGATAKRQAEHVAYMKTKAAENREKARQKSIKAAETAARIAAIVIITDRELIKSRKMTIPKIDEQLEAHRRMDKEVPIKARLNVKEKKVEALLAALDRYESIQMQA